jgi:signal transduction histidine kinase
MGCLAFSLLLRYVIIRQIDEDLKIEKNEITTYVNRFKHLPSVVEVHDQYITYQPVISSDKQAERIFTQEVLNKQEHEKELRRTIEFNIEAAGDWYLVSVSKSLEGTDKLIQVIIAITVSIILLILIATFVTNRIVLRKLWKPFYGTLHRLQQFDLSKPGKINFDATGIDEFQYLNSILDEALTKAKKDYQSLKEFTENASHELQTPLAVIQSKLDILIQNEKLSETESKTIQGAYDAVQHLKKINQSLLLLTKIENNQFSEKATIDISQQLQKKINQFSELWKAKNIEPQINLQPATLNINMQLADILLNNLLGNATRHNFQNGNIIIHLQPKNLTVVNSGPENAIDEKILFSRFSKANHSGESFGLGLSIIKQICDTSNFICSYSFQQPNMHAFAVTW